MSGRTIIHMNGRDYDASGANLKPLTPPTTPRAMDGVFAHPTKPLAHPVKRHVPSVTINRKPEKAKTLVRTAVKKPASLSDISPRHSLPAIVRHNNTAEHLQHIAQRVAPNPQIKKFNFDVKVTPMTPAPEPKTHHTPAPQAEAKSRSDQLIDRQMHRSQAHSAPAYHKKPLRDRVKYMSTSRRKILSVGASLCAVLLISGFIVYQSLPGISLGIASRRAGFSAMLPSFTPNGYALRGPVDYAPGKVILSFSSNTNDHKYQIEQTPSGWSSETLKEQVASSSGSQFQTFQARGLTIFFTNNNTATWVDRGVLFSLKGDSGLSGDQVASIASSM